MRYAARFVFFFAFYFLLAGRFLAQEPVLTLPVIAGRPLVVESVQGNRYLFVGDADFGSIWKAQSGQMLQSLRPGFIQVAEAPDKRTVALLRRNGIYFFDLEAFCLQDSLIIRDVSNIAYAKDGTLYASISLREELRLVSIRPHTHQIKVLFSTADFKRGGRLTLRLSNSGALAIVHPEQSTVSVIDLQTQQVVRTFEASRDNQYLFTPDDRILEIVAKQNNDWDFRLLNPNTFAVESAFSGNTKAIPYNNRHYYWLDKNRLLLCQSEISAVLDLSAKSIVKTHKYYHEYMPAMAFAIGQVQNGTVRTIYRMIHFPSNRLEEWNVEEYRKVRQIGVSAITPMFVSLSPSGFRFQMGDKREVTLGRVLKFQKVQAQNTESAYTPNGQYRFHFGNRFILQKFLTSDNSGKSVAFLTEQQGISRTIISMAFNRKGNLAGLVSVTGTYIVDVDNMRILQDVRIGKESEMQQPEDWGSFIDNDTKFVAVGRFEGGEYKTYCFDVATGAILWSVPGKNTHFRQTAEGILCFGRNELLLKWLNPKNGATIRTQDLGGGLNRYAAIKLAFSPDNKQVFYTESNRVYFYDIAARKRVPGEFNESQSLFWSVGYFPADPTYGLSVGEDGRIMLWNTREARRLATFYIFNDTEDWVCIAPGGLFDASPGGLQRLYYTKGKEIIPLEQLYEKYFTPGLITQIISGIKPEPEKKEDDIIFLKKPPTVKLKYQDKQRNLVVEDEVPTHNTTSTPVTVIVEAFAPDDVIDEIRLYHNGKLYGATSRNLVVEDDKKQQESQTFTISLIPGENRLKAIALNSQRTESAPAELIVNYTPAAPTPAPPTVSDIDLYGLVIGINKYKNPKYNLNYAVADAGAFREQIQQMSGAIFKSIQVDFIVDEHATQTKIIEAFERIKAAAQPKDVFVFYYAGHGVLNDRREFFLVPHDVTQLYGNNEALASKGLSAAQLQQFSKEIKAQKQLYLLDACQSAGAIEQFALRGAAEEKAIAQLARATGTHWLTASGSEQFASEFAQLGHGVFTYALLEGLKGKADTGDRKITVKEIDAYLQSVVPELTAKYKGSPQYPASYGFGNDFPLVIIR